FSHIFLFIEKIVENNYDVHFSRNGCSIYDLVLGTIFTPTLITLCSLVANKISFLHLFNSSLLGESEQLLTSHLSFDCATCKFGKNKVLPFQTMNSHAIKYFYIIYSDIWKISPVILMNVKKFLAYVETQFIAVVKVRRSNSDGESVTLLITKILFVMILPLMEFASLKCYIYPLKYKSSSLALYIKGALDSLGIFLHQFRYKQELIKLA
ncbi:hypothetical protein S83_028837, partial [Arachis hypogaea]